MPRAKENKIAQKVKRIWPKMENHDFHDSGTSLSLSSPEGGAALTKAVAMIVLVLRELCRKGGRKK